MAYKILTKNGIDNSNIDGARGEYFNSGMRDGIVQGALNEGLFIANTSNSISFDSCELRIAGHRIVIDEPVYHTFTNAPSSDTRYAFVAQIVVDANQNVDFSLFVQTASTPLIQNDLYKTITGAGTYQIEIGRFTLLTSLTIEDVVRTIDVITGGSGKSGSGGINVGNIITEKIEPEFDVEVDIDTRYEEDENKEYIDFKFSLPIDMTDTINKSNQALSNSQQAIETANNASSVANEALDYAVSGNGTAVYVEEKPQTKIYFTDDPQEQINKKISKRPASCIPFFADMWKPKTWNGLTNLDVRCIWSDGVDIYYSKGLEQYVLNVSTSTWKPKTWNGLDEAHLGYFNGYYTWYDGENIYLTASFGNSIGFETFSLNKETSTWELKTNINITFSIYFWTDGVDIYYSNSNSQYVLDKTTFTLKPKTWNGLTNPKATNIWSDGVDIYYSYGSEQYVLDKSTSTWKPKTWNGLTSFYGEDIWSDGENIYHSLGASFSTHYVLDKSTSTWKPKTWNGLTSFYGEAIWSDGVDIYYSSGSEQYVLCKQLKFEKKYL